MIIDSLQHAQRYAHLHQGMTEAFNYLRTTDLAAIAPGKYSIVGEDIFAIVQEYETLDAATEQMESHKKYIDVQYMISGEEQVGHALLVGQTPSQAYDPATDFMLFSEAPTFFTCLSAGMFMIFYPTDLHMPCIKTGEATTVKKVVVKVAVAE